MTSPRPLGATGDSDPDADEMLRRSKELDQRGGER